MRIACLVAGLLAALPLGAQPFPAENLKNHADLVRVVEGSVAQDGDGCSGGLVYDDGVFEDGYRLNTADGRLVQKIDVSSPAALKTACICWQAQGSGDSAVNFNILVYDDNGPGGIPGSLITTIPAAAAGVPEGLAGKFYRYDLSSSRVNVEGNVYLGVQVNGLAEPGIFLCTDEGFAAPRPAYASINAGLFWGKMFDLNSSFDAFGIRAELGSATNCVASDTAMCLNHGRFKVEATYQTPDGQTGAAKVVKLTDETGYLWFFNSANVETVVKVLDACGLNQRFWVFAGGLTNVRTTITVTDTETGSVKTYTNPQSTAFLPVQDTGAFATCN